MAGTGPMPMIPGGTPATAKCRKYARDLAAPARAVSPAIITTAAAPSFTGDEFPAVTVPVGSNTGFSDASFSAWCRPAAPRPDPP